MVQENKNSVEVRNSGDFHWVGNGFPVRSVFNYNELGQKLSPFLLLDYAAPYNFAPGYEKRGVGGHPHRGFETVTIAYQGEIEHRDSNGGGGIIGPGDVQWMTAASGLIHEEFHSENFTESGGTFEMVQLWVNLPSKFKSEKPRYQTILDKTIPRVQFSGDGGEARIIAGELHGVKGQALTYTPINVWDVKLHAQKTVQLAMPVGHSKAILVLNGEITVNGTKAKDGNIVIVDINSSGVEIDTNTSAQLLVLTGEPIDEPIVGYGPFVMNSEAEIKQAYVDFQMGKMGAL